MHHVDASKTKQAEERLRAEQEALSGGISRSGTARIDLSSRAHALQKAKDLASENSVDHAKVARLQKLIDEGKYNVDAKSIADRLVDEHLNMPE